MSNIKKCTKCGRELTLDRFCRRGLKSGSIKYESICKDCHREYNAKWRRANPGKDAVASAKWRGKNKEKAKEARARRHQLNPDKKKSSDARWQKKNLDKRRITNARWRQDNLGYFAKRKRERRVKNPEFKLLDNIRGAMYHALRGNFKASHTEELLGCSIADARKHLEGLFKSGMTWNNYGRYGWHIDHIIPISYFDFSDPEQQKRAWHYTNLQPLWAKDNRVKGDKIVEVQLVLL